MFVCQHAQMFENSFITGSETWHLLSQGGSEAPTARHRHTAVLHDNALWIHGGMTDLQEKSDFWRFDFGKSVE